MQDIIDNVQAIFRYTADMDLTAFEGDRLVYDAVERCLERICEATAKLGDLALVLMPHQPWYKIRALGNVLRHEYDDIERDRVFEIVKTDLPALVAACQKALQKLQESEQP